MSEEKTKYPAGKHPNSVAAMNSGIGKRFSSEYQPIKNGRKPGYRNLTTLLRESMDFVLETEDPFDGAERIRTSVKNQIVLTTIKKAIKDQDLNAIKFIFDRVDGLLKQTIEQENVDKTKEYFIEMIQEKMREYIQDDEGDK